MANLFAKPVYADESTPSQPATGQNPTQTSTSGNLFTQPQYDPDEQSPASKAFVPPSIDNGQTVGSAIGNGALEIGKGLAGGTQKTAETLGLATGALPMLYDKLKSVLTRHETTEAQDAWFRTFVDPAIAAQQQLRPGPGFVNQALNGAGATLQQIAQAVLSGPESEIPVATGSVAQTVANTATRGAAQMSAPAVENAVDTGRRVMDQTGDANAAVKAAQTDYLTTAASGILPVSAEGGLLKRMATGAASSMALGETERATQNSFLPNGEDPYTPEQRREAALTGQPIPLPQDQTTPFSLEQLGQEALSGALMGGVMGERGEPAHGVREQPRTAMEQAQLDAARIVQQAGGDALDQVKAAATVNMHVGAVHDAHAYENAQQLARAQMAADAQRQAQDAAIELQAKQQEAQPAQTEAPLDQSAPQLMRGQIPEEPDVNAVIARQEKNQAFEQAEDQQAALRSEQEREAYNQRGQQAADESVGAERGGGAEPAPTIADTLTPEQQTAFEALRQRRLAEAGQPNEPDVGAELASQNPEDAFQPLPPGAGKETPAAPKLPRTLAERREMGMQAFGPKPGEPKALPAPEQEDVLERPGKGPDVVKPGRIDVNTAGEATVKTPTEVQAELSQPNGLLLRRKAVAVEQPAKEIKEVNPVDQAAQEAAPHPDNDLPEPTQAQYMAGNFKMGHTEVHGLPVTIEYPKGSERPGPEDAEPRKMAAHYGYVKGTVDADGQATDVLVGGNPESDKVWVVDHIGPDGDFEQHKSMLGFDSRLAAMRAYRKAFPDNPMGPVKEMSADEYKDFIKNGDLSKPLQPRAVNRLKGRGMFSGDAARKVDTSELENLARRQEEVRRSATGNNASGESAASQEAVNRVAQEKAAGQDRYLINPDGKATPLTGVDSVDAKAPPGHVIVQRGIGIDTHSILDRGGLSAMHARGLVNRAQAMGELPEPHPGQFRENESSKAPESTPSPTLRARQIYRHIRPLLDKVGADSVSVHDSPDAPTVPPEIKQSMENTARAGNYNLAPGRVRGFYDTNTGTVHIFADAHRDPEMARRTAVHEIVGHKGLRALLGTDHVATMRDIFKAARNREWLKDFAEQHELDTRSPDHQRLMGEEYAAHLAETAEDPGLLQKAIDSVRSGLRSLGLVHEWSDNDIKALLRKSETNLGKISRTAASSLADAARQSGRFAVADDGPEIERQFPPDHPMAQGYKFGNTVESQANYNKGFIRSRMDAASDWTQNSIEARLAFIPRRNLADFMPEHLMPSLREFTRVLTRMDGRRNELINRADSLARDWAQHISKDKQSGRRLGELMHASTLLGVDPSKPFEPKYSEPDEMQAAEDQQRRSYHNSLRRVYNSNELGDKGRELFNTIRDFYSRQRGDVMHALQKRIEQSAADNNTKQQLITQLREKFESGKVQGPYFPLARFGDYWASAKDKEGKVVSFSRFESPSKQRQWVQEMQNHGLLTEGGKKMDEPSILSRVDPTFAHKVAQLAQAVDPKLADDIWQHYLKSMPEMSMRKHFIHRQGRLGYTADALRAFAFNAFHGAHQQARLEYGNALDGTMDKLHEEAEALQQTEGPGGRNAKWAAPLYKEMAKRYEWARNPKSSVIASQLTKFGFGWYLGAAPATAFRIFTQNPMLAQPILAKHFGQWGSSRELLKASGQWARAKTDFSTGRPGSLADQLRGDERLAMDEANRAGLFSNTNTQSLASGGNGSPMYGWSDKAAHVLGYMFNAMEHHNRETTFIAAYRLARSQGATHNAAIEKAENLTWDAHFDYSNANRPRVLQNDFAKVALLFRQYAWNVTYRLAREFRDMTKAQADPAERLAATHAFGSLIAREMAFAGVTGLPLYWIAEKVVNTVMGDDNRPFDMTAAWHKDLNDAYGEGVGDAIMTGPVGSITGASLSGGASYNDLWLRDMPEDASATQRVANVIGQMGGPIVAIATNAAEGLSIMGKGMMERGLEHFLPPSLAGPAKALRYSREGVQNLSGESIVPQKDITNRDLFLQSMGFTPQHIADQYARNTAIKGVAKAVQERRQLLMNQLFLAVQQGDKGMLKDTVNDVMEFDKRNPGVAIKPQSVIPSIIGHFKRGATAVNGVNIPPGLSDLYSTYGAPSK